MDGHKGNSGSHETKKMSSHFHLAIVYQANISVQVVLEHHLHT